MVLVKRLVLDVLKPRLGAPRLPIGYAPTLENQIKLLAERDIFPTLRLLARHSGRLS